MSERKRLSRGDMSRKCVDVDILDGFVTLKYPALGDVLEMKNMVADGKQDEVAVKLILLCVVDEKGEPMYADESQVRSELTIEAFAALAVACMKFITPNLEQASKN